jgi:three-Cys-motif partner protein
MELCSMATNTNPFFSQRTPSSIAKSRIVWKYFDAYLGALGSSSHATFTFADLFSGPGSYDSSVSTPIELLDLLDKKPKHRDRVKLLFNDQNAQYIEVLTKAVNNRLEENPLRFEPQFSSVEIGAPESSELLSKIHGPSLTFLDPFGYQGITRELIRSLTSEFAAEVILFFNFNRVNAAIPNPVVKHHMEGLFESQGLKVVNDLLNSASSLEKPGLIMSELGRALGDGNDRRVFRHAFMATKAQRVSHYLLFVTKHDLGMKLFSDICSREGHIFVFSENPLQLDIFGSGGARLDAIATDILLQFSGQVLTVGTIVGKYNHRHHQSHPAEIKDVLRYLEESGQINPDPASSQRSRMSDGRVTMGDKILVAFP